MAGSPMRVSWQAPIELRRRLLLKSLAPADGESARRLLEDLRPSVNGINDYEVSTACEVLLALDKRSEAREALIDFLRIKRIGSHPPSYSLQIAAARLDEDAFEIWHGPAPSMKNRAGLRVSPSAADDEARERPYQR